MGGNGVSTSYTSSTQTVLPDQTNVWFVIDPAVIGSTTSTNPPSYSSLTLKIYVQAAKPTAADTPWHTESVSGANFDSIGHIYAGTGDSYWSKIDWTLEDYWTFRPADTGLRTVPYQHETGANEDISATAYTAVAVPYLGTDKVYETGETT